MPQNADSDESSSATYFDLLCCEDAAELLVDYVAVDSVEYPADDSDESMAEFLECESDHSPGVDYPARLRSASLDPSARLEFVAWILKVQAFHGFQPVTAYLAVNYLDRFLSAHQLPEGKQWALQLLSVACLSLAAKMEETLAPSLVDLQVEGARFVFEPRTVCKMELLVLAALKWRLRSVTPFTFVDFFARKADADGTHARCLVLCATRIILSTLHDFKFLDHCASSVAAAAVICAAGETPGLGLVDVDSAVSWCTGLTHEGIAGCYRLMQEARATTTTTTTSETVIAISDPSFDAASSSSSLQPNKRRKLNNCLIEGGG